MKVYERLADELVAAGVKVAFGIRDGDVLMENAVEKEEGGDAHVGGAVDKDGAILEGVHHAAEGLEIPRGGGLEVHRDVNVGHAEAGDEAAFVGERVVGCGQGEVDDGLEAGVADGLELLGGGLAGGAATAVGFACF